MSALIRSLRTELLAHVDAPESGRRPLGKLGVFHCTQVQSIRAVPIHQPTMVLVIAGKKELYTSSRKRVIRAGELLLVPANLSLTIGNIPEPGLGAYLALSVSFQPDAVELFRRIYAPMLGAPEQRNAWSAHASASVLRALHQWVSWCIETTPDVPLALHRQTELLLLLAQTGQAGHLLLAPKQNWRQRVSQLLALDPGYPWEAVEVSRRLNVGESSLRRYLREEQASFRKVLEEVRLVAGLALLQETRWPVARIAAEVGYESPSRFAERFKGRFGITPSELKSTRLSVHGESASVGGETVARRASNLAPVHH